MSNKKQIEEFMNNASGFITPKQVTEAGFHRSILSELLKTGELDRVARGIYLKPEDWEDEMYLLQ
ncbi:MAG: type IV toxin-antitoxin system AbiEi family antitoxin domain-containing protein [Methanimicrococcus sp.]|nr:type IV toxin-antitoxin system AbiEi family antitoxin domain-containing protein [Methanimicrococcus sp.]